MGLDAMICVFWKLSFVAAFSLSSFTFIKGLFSSFSLSAIGVVPSSSEVVDISLSSLDYDLSNPAFHMMYSAYKVNKQGDCIQPWHTPFPVWNQSVVPCLVLTVASWPVYRFLKKVGKVAWYSYLFKNFPHFLVIHTIKGFSIVTKAEVDVFLEFTCFLCDPTSIGSLIWFLCLF